MRQPHALPYRHRRPRRRRGFSLVELLVASILIGVALLGIAQTHALVLRHRNEARARAAAIAAASSRLERLAGSPCADATGGASSQVLTESWSVGAMAHTREIADSVSFGASSAHAVVLQTRLPC